MGAWAPHVYNNIITFNWQPPMGDFIPDLAERWEADGPTFTFHFRDDVTWHDGQAFTAGDAMYSLENQKGRIAPQLNDIVSMATPDDRTLTVTLQQPRASFLSALAIIQTPIYAQHVREAAGGTWTTARPWAPAPSRKETTTRESPWNSSATLTTSRRDCLTSMR